MTAHRRGDRLTIDALWRLARDHVPRVALDPSRLGHTVLWGPAHEVAHMLLASSRDRARPMFGLGCSPGCCTCRGERCHVVELAAMDVSRRLLLATGRGDLVRAELEATTDYDMMVSRWTMRAARALVTRRRLRRIPRTTSGLKRMLTGLA